MPQPEVAAPGRVRLLGPVALVTTEVRVPAGRRQAALLALLALNGGGAVMPGRLIQELWPAVLPAEPGAALQSQVSRLRRFLGPGLLLHRSGGYALAVPPLEVDVQTFDRLVRSGLAALAAGAHELALESLQSALAQWEGDPMADLADQTFASRSAGRLVEQRLAATAAAIEAEIALGGHLAVLGRLTELTMEHPLREDLWALRLLALYRSGRAADALSAHRSAREVLDREVGLDPGPTLQRLEHAILVHDPRLGSGFPVATPTTRPPAPP